MKYFKMTVMFRSIDVLYDYRRKKGVSFWDDFEKKAEEVFPNYKLDKKSGMHCIFYFPYDDEADVAQKTAAEWITALTSSTDTFFLTIAPLTSAEIENLQNDQSNTESQNEWLRSAAASLENAQPSRPAAAPAGSDTPAAEAGSGSAPAAGGPAAPAAAASEPAKPKTLAEEAEHIEAFRSALLSKVHGQRHAVDEVVQTIFECDAFAGQDEKRKGPLASFLFVGPSGVGKTFLAEQCAEHLDRGKPLIVDMSAFSDNLANGKFNGDHGQDALVTQYVMDNPRGIIVFDEIEKAHINTIYLFLQILDRGTLRDMRRNKEVSFRDNIIIITTNAGSSLYEDATVCNLSNIPRKVILEALRNDTKSFTGEPVFPECITTRFANGHVVLFNHLEPYALMQIISDEIEKQVELFKKSYDVEIDYDAREISALILYHAGGTQDARTLRGLAKSFLIKELQDAIVKTFAQYGKDVDQLKRIRITLNVNGAQLKARSLFETKDKMHVLTFADAFIEEQIRPYLSDEQKELDFFSDLSACKKRARGVVDYILLDPASGLREMDNLPYDIEDIKSDGMELFEYLITYYPEIPIYILDTRMRGKEAFETLIAKGARDVVSFNEDAMAEFAHEVEQLSFNVLINNNTFSLGRSGKVLNYNCSQFMQDSETVLILVDRLSLGLAPSSDDKLSMAAHDEQNGVKFDDVIGCKKAKEALQEFCKFVENPRELVLSGKRIPKGVLLYGPPGTGKTMLAKAMANETQAAFFPTSATTFFGMYVGESEKNVRELFRKARKYAPAVIFIDEVDAIGRQRTGSFSTAHNEDTLNAFLAEMDGFVSDPRRPVFIVAATNYGISGDGGRVLDPAFVRRFDRKIYVDLPDVDEREQFLLRNLKKHSVDFGADHQQIIRNMAQRSSGMSNADLEIIVDMFLRSVADKAPEAKDLMDALDSFRFGDIRKINEAELRQTAYHEAGHALINTILGNVPAFLTIVSRGNFGGFMEYEHDETKTSFTFEELMNRVCCSLAGRAAEMLVYGEVAGNNTGASSDIEHARSMIRHALDDYAMGSKLFSKSSYRDGEEMMQQQFERARTLLSEHRAVLDRLTDLLVKEKSLDKTTLEEFFAVELPDRKA